MISIRSNKVYSDSLTTIFVLESVVYQPHKMTTTYHFYGSIKPLAVVVCNSDKIYAFDMEANEITLEELRRQNPELNCDF